MDNLVNLCKWFGRGLEIGGFLIWKCIWFD